MVRVSVSVPVCVRAHACLSVRWTAVPSLAYPLSFPPLPNPPISWIPYLLPLPSQGVQEGSDTVSGALLRSGFSLPEH